MKDHLDPISIHKVNSVLMDFSAPQAQISVKTMLRILIAKFINYSESNHYLKMKFQLDLLFFKCPRNFLGKNFQIIFKLIELFHSLNCNQFILLYSVGSKFKLGIQNALSISNVFKVGN